MTLAQRAQSLLGLGHFREPNYAEPVQKLELEVPVEPQYVLRMPIMIPGHFLVLPLELRWAEPFVVSGFHYQRNVVCVRQPYAYLTVRSGPVTSVTDDEWHVDGFSMKVPHIPEQNYVWVDKFPTETASFPTLFPLDFDPLRHNIHWYLQDRMPRQADIRTLEPKTVYGMDPYVLHRRPPGTLGSTRCFLRLSFTPIPIDDVNNAINPAFGNICSDNDGITMFRDQLERY